MENEFSPITESDYNVVYQKCVWKNLYYLNIIVIGLLILKNILSIGIGLSDIGEAIGSRIFIFTGLALGWFLFGPSGVRRVYNKSKGSKNASTIAFFLCTWLNLVGWIICWIYEKL